MLTAPPTYLSNALAQDRLRLHHQVLPVSLVTSAVMAATVAFLLAPEMGRRSAALWLLFVLVVLAARAALRLWHGRAAQPIPEPWLLRYRIGFAAHGLLWASLVPWAGAELDHRALSLLVFPLAAVSGGALVSSAFDRVAAWLFAAPVVLALLWRLLGGQGQAAPELALVLLVFIGTMAVGLGRIHSVWVGAVAQRRAMATRLQDLQQAQTDLSERTQDLQRTLEATGDAIFASDAAHPSEPLRFINPRMRQMWGLAAEGPITPAQVFAAARPLWPNADEEEARVRAIIAHNQADESTLRLNDGRVILRRCMPSPWPSGTMRVWSFRDITSEHRALQALRASEQEQRLLLEAFPGFITGLGEDMRYVFVNQRAAALLGQPAAQIVGQDVASVLGPQGLENARQEMALAWAGVPVQRERVYPPKGPRGQISVEVEVVAGSRLADGRRVCYAFGVDISARKRAEAALIEARDEANAANQAKSRFLAQMSHELRTPLNAILGFAQLLQTDATLALDERQRQQLQAISGGGQHLLGLINELLDFSRVEAGQLRVALQIVPLLPLLQELVALVRPLAAARGLKLLPLPPVDEAAALLADPMRVKQVLLNLLGNAVKYNREEGELELQLQASADGFWRVGVRDGGPGLDASQQARLFTPFERLDAGLSAVEGSGIGLALSRRLVEHMGGRIGVHSTPGEGSVFWFELPQAQLPAEQEAQTQPSPLQALTQVLRPQRVLYIEDNAVNAALMEAMLARLPQVQLMLAADPQEGLRLAQQERPHLVLLDIQLPGMDGFEVLARLRALPNWRGAPVVAVSANGQGEHIDAARAAGFTEYLTKPLALDLLLSTVQRLLARH